MKKGSIVFEGRTITPAQIAFMVEVQKTEPNGTGYVWGASYVTSDILEKYGLIYDREVWTDESFDQMVNEHLENIRLAMQYRNYGAIYKAASAIAGSNRKVKHWHLTEKGSALLAQYQPS